MEPLERRQGGEGSWSAGGRTTLELRDVVLPPEVEGMEVIDDC
jgi:hypothetical protein